MSTAQKTIVAFFSMILLAVLAVVGYAMIFPERLTNVLAPGSVFSWENFNPFSRDPGLFGISPLIWTALFVLPAAVLIPALIYFFEKKKVPGVVRVVLAATRAGVLLVLYLLIAGPSLVDTETYVEGSKVAVLIDDSISMGGESREFPIFNVFDDREAADVRATRERLTTLGIFVAQPPSQGFLTLDDSEFELRNFVRRLVRERAARLSQRLSDEHGGQFDIASWQRLRAEIDGISAEADLKQSELSAETSKDEPEEARARRLQSELDELMRQLLVKEEDFAALLGGSPDDADVRRKRALIENLLETCHPEGPRRWDIACELVTEGSTLAAIEPDGAGLIDVLRRRASELAENDQESRNETRMPLLRFFVFSTRFGRDQVTDESILEVAPEDLDFRAPTGRLTEVEAALREVRRYYTQEDDLSTVILLSDGRDTSPADSFRPDEVARPRGGVEVVSVAIGNPRPVRVLELLSVSADREILVGDSLDFSLRIRADKAYRADPETGRTGQRVKILLAQDSVNNLVPYQELNGRTVRGEEGMEVELGSSELTEVKVRFQPPPGVTGRRVYFLKVNEDRLPDEDTYRNNVKQHEVEIIDRKIRVLYLEQRFRYDARALNEALKRDRKLEYQGYFFDAQDGWTQPTSQYEEDGAAEVLSLQLPFFADGRAIRNKEDFFKQDYDVIILGDVNPDDSRFRREHWDWIEEWVSYHRGGLILLAGQNHNPNSYRNIEKARALYPVELDFPLGYEQQVDTRSMKYWRLTPAGRAHEVHRLSANTARNDELWGSVSDGVFRRGQLQGLYWYQVTGGIKPAPAVALSRVAREGRISGEGEVLSAAMPYGNGTVLYVGSDDTWLWREFVGDHYFYRFWQNSMRFVASRRLRGKQQRVDLYTDKTSYQVGEQVKIYVELMGDIYNEVTQNQTKELSELPRTGDEHESRRLMVDLQARAGGRLSARRVVLTEVGWSPNLFEGVVEANEPGQYDVWVLGYEESRKQPHRYSVTAPVAELRDLTMDFQALQRRATDLPTAIPPMEYQGGKRVYLMTDMGRAALEIRERENQVKGMTSLLWNRQDEPWNLRSLLLFVFILLLAGEWLTRKLVRMV